MSPRRARMRRLLSIGLLALVAVVSALIYGRPPAGDGTGVPFATVAELAAHPDEWAGQVVSLDLEYGLRRDNDPVAPVFTRSDAYLHDATGSILMLGAWQIHNRWQETGTGGGAPNYSSPAVDIDAAGHWHVKEAAVGYTADGLPYLEPVD